MENFHAESPIAGFIFLKNQKLKKEKKLIILLIYAIRYKRS